MSELPPVENIDVPVVGLTLVDIANVTKEEGQLAGRIMTEQLQGQVLDVVRPGQFLCGTEQSEFEDQNYQLETARNPRLTYEDFIANATDDQIVADISMCDPRLGQKTLVAMDASRLNHGLFIIYNIKIETQDPTKVVANAMPMPGLRAPRGQTKRATWSLTMRTVLANDLHFGPARVIDIIGWRFPTRDGMRWNETQEVDGLSGDLVIQDVSFGNDLTKTPGGVPLEIRRRPPPPGR